MTEEERMTSNVRDEQSVKDAKLRMRRSIPYSVLADDISGTRRADFNDELTEIKKYYEVYERGMDVVSEGSHGDYIPSQLRFKKAASLVNKVARFMFSTPVDFYVNRDERGSQEEIGRNTKANDYLQKVLQKNFFNKNIIKACKDCLIGKRVALLINFDSEYGIDIDFLNSTEFYYEMRGMDNLTKLVAFFVVVESSNNHDKRIRKKVYELENGFCYVTELLYDGTGMVVEEVMPRTKTLLEYIPAVVILNDGLTNDIKGESEIAKLMELEEYYTKISNGDLDAERKCMNPIRYTIDASVGSTSNLSTAPGAYWDIQSDDNGVEQKKASVGQMESNMSYSQALDTTLDRIDNQMYNEMSVPNVASDKLQGVITSGKTLKALYWDLSTRCDEKMETWIAALRFMVNTIFDGSWKYTDVQRFYTSERLPLMELDVSIENNYALPEDEQEEKTMDLAEVTAQTMSRKAYMKKWRGLTDEECLEELRQIAMEQEMLEGNTFGYDTSSVVDNQSTDTETEEPGFGSEEETVVE